MRFEFKDKRFVSIESEGHIMNVLGVLRGPDLNLYGLKELFTFPIRYFTVGFEPEDIDVEELKLTVDGYLEVVKDVFWLWSRKDLGIKRTFDHWITHIRIAYETLMEYCDDDNLKETLDWFRDLAGKLESAIWFDDKRSFNQFLQKLYAIVDKEPITKELINALKYHAEYLRRIIKGDER